MLNDAITSRIQDIPWNVWEIKINQFQNGTSTSLSLKISRKKRDCAKNSVSFKELRLTLEAPVLSTCLINARSAAWQFLQTLERIRGWGRSSDSFSWHRVPREGRRLGVGGLSVRHSWALESTDSTEPAGKRHQNRQSNRSQTKVKYSDCQTRVGGSRFPERAGGA